MEERRSHYLGAYFSRETILRLAAIARIASWVVVGIYAAQWLIQFVANILSVARGYWIGLGCTDIAMIVATWFEQPLRGVVYFIVLQAVAQALLLFMDLEDNTRRAARSAEQIGSRKLPRP